MKKLWIVVFLIVGFLGCGSDSSVTVGEEEKVEVENILTKELTYIWDYELLSHTKNFKILNTQRDFDLFVDKVDTNMSKQSIDFKKYNILIYSTRYNTQGQLDNYQENIEDNGSIVIHQNMDEKNTGNICHIVTQIRVYKLSKSITELKIIHENEISLIDITNLNAIKQTKIVNIFTDVVNHPPQIKVFNSNENLPINLADNIDFDKYRILIDIFHEGFPIFSKIEESFILEDESRAKIVHKIVNVDSSCTTGTFLITPLPSSRRVYKVSKEISIVRLRDDIVVDMESGEVN